MPISAFLFHVYLSSRYSNEVYRHQEQFLNIHSRQFEQLLIFLFAFIMAFAVSAAFAADTEEAEVKTDFDFVKFAQEKVLPDYHPTVNVSKAAAEVAKEPYVSEPGVVSSQINIFYSGWIKSHSMEINIDYREADRSVRVAVLNDTNQMNLKGSTIFKEDRWIKLSSIGW